MRDKVREPWGRDLFIAVNALSSVSCQDATFFLTHK
jgi:hypothetical protein